MNNSIKKILLVGFISTFALTSLVYISSACNAKVEPKKQIENKSSKTESEKKSTIDIEIPSNFEEYVNQGNETIWLESDVDTDTIAINVKTNDGQTKTFELPNKVDASIEIMTKFNKDGTTKPLDDGSIKLHY